MSATASRVTVAPRFERTSTSDARPRPESARRLIRLATLAALALYGVGRWATLTGRPPTARLLGLTGLAVALAVGVPAMRRFGSIAALVVAVGLCLLALPIAGLPWQWFVHVRIAVGAREIGHGLTGLPSALVPYNGASHAVRSVIALGAGVLLLDAAIVIAFAPPALGDARRAGAALPLIALAVVPSTLVRPELPYLQGLMLFALLAAFMWGERVRREAIGAALLLVAAAGAGAAIAAPHLDQHRPWLDYRAWTGTVNRGRLDAFNWNQTYGPLHWPRTGHVVMTVRAGTGDYWKAENLDTFNGHAWELSPATIKSPLPAPSRSAAARWTQSINVTIDGMKTNDVIAAGYANPPSPIAGGANQGADPGTWIAGRELGPGTTYTVSTYSPHPSAAELARAGPADPAAALAPYRTISLPQADEPASAYPQVRFPAFHSRGSVQLLTGGLERRPLQSVLDSPYGRAYALARRLAAHAATPYAFAASVERFLSRRYSYNERPPVRPYPLAAFLFGDRVGYCQQFSGAMALLLRMGGMPARVAAGFTSGTRSLGADGWVVTDTDAHAWVEAWFPHYGWVRFDPTPSVAPARGGQAALPVLKNLPGSLDAARPSPHPLGANAARPVGGARGSGGGGPSPLLIVGVLAGLAGLAGVAWVIRSLVRAAPSPEDLVGELERALARTKRPLAPGVTLVALESRFRDVPGAAGYVRSLRLARYAGHSGRPTPAARRALREQLRLGLGVSGRLRALWALPPRRSLRAFGDLRRGRGL